MKAKKFISSFAVFFILLITILASICYFFYQENINEVLQKYRLRRSYSENTINGTMTGTYLSSTEIISKMMEEKRNKIEIREEENVLATALAKLLITSPEDIMKFLTDENFGCRKINHSLNVFQKNFNRELSKNNTYIKLFHSLFKFHNLICGENEAYRKLFMQSQEKIEKMHEQFAICAGELDWYEKNVTIACTEGQNILDCYHEALVYEVGEKVAYYFDYIFKSIINSALNHSCKFKKLQLTFKDVLETSGKSKHVTIDYFLFTFILFCEIVF